MKLSPAPDQIGLRHKILSVGSCFADCMGQRLAANKLAVLANPFGTVFNPPAALSLLRHSQGRQAPAADAFVCRDGIYYHELFHSTFSAPEQAALAARMDAALAAVHQWLLQADWLLLTWGTALVYRSLRTGRVVGNCHKLPAAAFAQTLLQAEEVVDDFADWWSLVRASNPRLKVILTVSPVRHLRDDLALNAVSKSVLRLACHALQARFESVDYFPAYELVLDDLRDYRFYGTDLVHPNELAEAYVWDAFCERHLDAEARAFLQAWQPLRKAVAHRPVHPGTGAHQQFVQKTLQRLQQLGAQYGVDFSKEVQQMTRQRHAQSSDQ